MPSKIEWTEETWNPVTGCSKISEGCKNCYAERMSKRLAGRYGYPKDDPFKVTFHLSRLDQPMKWKKARRVFVSSMGDIFHDDVRPEWIATVIEKAKQATRKQYKHTWMFLTKRPENIIRWRQWGKIHCPQTVAWFQHCAWLGVTAENQKRADERIPILLQIPAAVRFVSVEPMLGPVDLSRAYADEGPRKTYIEQLDWVICGGESGPGARPMHPDWARELRNYCFNCNIPFFFKQWGQWTLKNPWNRIKHNGFGVLSPNGTFYKAHTGWNGRPIDPDTGEAYMINVGKKKAGRELDGHTWDQYPGGKA